MNPRFEQIEMRYKKRLMFASELHYIPGVIPSIGNKNKLTSSREIEKIISHDKICRGIPRKFYHRLKFSLWAKISAWRAAFEKYATFETNVSLPETFCQQPWKCWVKFHINSLVLKNTTEIYFAFTQNGFKDFLWEIQGIHIDWK
jgi:hypothetical protein